MKYQEHREAGSSMGIALEVALAQGTPCQYHNSETALGVYECDRRNFAPIEAKRIRNLNPAQRAAFQQGFAAGRCSALAFDIEELAGDLPVETLEWLRTQLRGVREHLKQAPKEGGT